MKQNIRISNKIIIMHLYLSFSSKHFLHSIQLVGKSASVWTSFTGRYYTKNNNKMFTIMGIVQHFPTCFSDFGLFIYIKKNNVFHWKHHIICPLVIRLSEYLPLKYYHTFCLPVLSSSLCISDFLFALFCVILQTVTDL